MFEIMKNVPKKIQKQFQGLSDKNRENFHNV
jgi:hypothetical protein